MHDSRAGEKERAEEELARMKIELAANQMCVPVHQAGRQRVPAYIYLGLATCYYPHANLVCNRGKCGSLSKLVDWRPQGAPGAGGVRQPLGGAGGGQAGDLTPAKLAG